MKSKHDCPDLHHPLHEAETCVYCNPDGDVAVFSGRIYHCPCCGATVETVIGEGEAHLPCAECEC